MKENCRFLVIHGIEKQHTPLSGRQNHSTRPAVTSQGTGYLSADFWGKRKLEVQGYQQPICHWGSTTKVDVPAAQFWRAGCGRHSPRVHPSVDIARFFLAANCLAHNLKMPMATLALSYMHGIRVYISQAPLGTLPLSKEMPPLSMIAHPQCPLQHTPVRCCLHGRKHKDGQYFAFLPTISHRWQVFMPFHVAAHWTRWSRQIIYNGVHWRWDSVYSGLISLGWP